VSNLNHPGRKVFTEGRPVPSLDTSHPHRLPQAVEPAAETRTETASTYDAAKEMRFAVLSLTAAVALWALLLSVLASRLEPPSLF